MKGLVRIGAWLGAAGMLAAGGFALANTYLPESGAVAAVHDELAELLIELAARQVPGVPDDVADRIDPFLARPEILFGLAPAGLVLLLVSWWLGRTPAVPDPEASDEDFAQQDTTRPVDVKERRKAVKQAVVLAKRGRAHEAAELCFMNGLLEEAAGYFVDAEEFERAAEIRHDQNRFIESAELYEKAGRFDSAASIFGQQEEWLRSGEAYAQAGNLSVAGEMFEKAGEHRRAADAFAESGFPRNAAKNYVKCRQWEKAATCLEDVIRDESAAAGGDGRRLAEVRKLVMNCGELYKRAQKLDRAQAVLERGGCFGPAAELALINGAEEQAADLFLKAKDVPRAAEVMRKLGQAEEAARHLAEFHRDRGEQELAARHFEEAGELLSAGDLYRLMEQYERAGEVYERFGDTAQAAEMYGLAGDRLRAAACYEQAGLYREAAECAALAGDGEREAGYLAQAGAHFKAAKIHSAAGREDEALAVLQQVTPDDAEFAEASALLGGIFRKRGQLALAIKKLGQATTGQEITRANVAAFYALASCLEEDGKPAEATDLYEKILTFDFSYEDVGERVEKTRAAAAKQPAQPGATPLSSSGAAGRYEVLGTLGRGGMGIVYKAHDTVLDRTVAFKVLPSSLQENPQALKNFLREAKSAAALNHPNIVTVYDAGEQDGHYYIAMEYVDGNTLKEIVKHRGKISPAGIVHVLTQICEALAYAHDQKIVHRDIKTANAMWTRDRKAKIMDFGLAKVIEEVRNHTTVVSGTPYYMSPEQTLGRNIDHRTDIYSLGVSVFELATGTLPFTEGNLPYHHVHTPPPDPREIDDSIPPVLAELVLRCMQKDPADRYQSTREMLDDLKRILRPGAAVAS